VIDDSYNKLEHFYLRMVVHRAMVLQHDLPEPVAPQISSPVSLVLRILFYNDLPNIKSLRIHVEYWDHQLLIHDVLPTAQ